MLWHCMVQVMRWTDYFIGKRDSAEMPGSVSTQGTFLKKNRLRLSQNVLQEFIIRSYKTRLSPLRKIRLTCGTRFLTCLPKPGDQAQMVNNLLVSDWLYPNRLLKCMGGGYGLKIKSRLTELYFISNYPFIIWIKRTIDQLVLRWLVIAPFAISINYIGKIHFWKCLNRKTCAYTGYRFCLLRFVVEATNFNL